MRILCQLMTLLLLLWPAHSAAKPLRASSDNFVLRGDISEKNGKSLLKDMELFRESIFYFMGLEPVDEAVAVQVYVAKNDKELREISGLSGFGGLYTMTHNGPSLLINGKGGFGREGQARHIALHEFSHHLFTAHSPYALPRWYNEGLANYLATFTYKDGVFNIGKPYRDAQLSLGSLEWLPIETLLESVGSYPFEAEEGALNRSLAAQKYYAQSWLMVHYLQSNISARIKVRDYLLRLKAGELSLKAFEGAFKISPEAFQSKLRAYHSKGDFESRLYSRAHQPLPDIKTRKLSAQELHLAKLSFRRDFSLNGPRAADTLSAIEKYERKYEVSAASLILKADLASFDSKRPEDFARSYAHIQNALALEPDNRQAKLIAAKIIVYGQAQYLPITQEQRAQARLYIQEAVEDNSNQAFAHHLGRKLAPAPSPFLGGEVEIFQNLE